MIHRFGQRDGAFPLMGFSPGMVGSLHLASYSAAGSLLRLALPAWVLCLESSLVSQLIPGGSAWRTFFNQPMIDSIEVLSLRLEWSVGECFSYFSSYQANYTGSNFLTARGWVVLETSFVPPLKGNYYEFGWLYSSSLVGSRHSIRSN